MPFGRYTCTVQRHTVLDGGPWPLKEGRFRVKLGRNMSLQIAASTWRIQKRSWVNLPARFRLSPSYFGFCCMSITFVAVWLRLQKRILYYIALYQNYNNSFKFVILKVIIQNIAYVTLPMWYNEKDICDDFITTSVLRSIMVIYGEVFHCLCTSGDLGMTSIKPVAKTRNTFCGMRYLSHSRTVPAAFYAR